MQGAEGTLPSKVYKFVACAHVPHMLIAQRGRNSSCQYFYRSLGCPQLTLSSCDTGCNAVVKDKYSLIANLEGASLNPGKAIPF